MHYGLGIEKAKTPCGAVWDHVGVVPGYATYKVIDSTGRRRLLLRHVHSHGASAPDGRGPDGRGQLPQLGMTHVPGIEGQTLMLRGRSFDRVVGQADVARRFVPRSATKE